MEKMNDGYNFSTKIVAYTLLTIFYFTDPKQVAMEQYRAMIPESAFCPISGKIMTDPVTIGEDVYDRSSLTGMATTVTTSRHVLRMIQEMLVITAKQWKSDKKAQLESLLTIPSKDPRRIFIKTMTTKVYTINIDPQQSVHALKNEIAKETNIPVDQIRLVYKGRQMEDERCLVEYGVTTDSEVYMILRLRGGMLHSSSGRAGFAGFAMGSAMFCTLSSDMQEFVENMIETFRSRRMDCSCSVDVAGAGGGGGGGGK